MPDDTSFDDVMRRLKMGDQRAAREVFERYVQRLIALAGTRLERKIRRKVDPDDVVQSVFKSFFARHKNDQYELANWNQLWGLLAAITIHKCGRKIEYFRAACRDVSKEHSSPLFSDDSQAKWEAIANEPTASQIAILDELIANLLKDLEGDDRQILLLGLQGATTDEIGREVGCSERTARRVLNRVQRNLEANREA